MFFQTRGRSCRACLRSATCIGESRLGRSGQVSICFQEDKNQAGNVVLRLMFQGKQRETLVLQKYPAVFKGDRPKTQHPGA